MEKLWVQDRVGVHDMILLDSVQNHEDIVNNLKIRFHQNITFTYIGPVLISMNPYKNIVSYDEKTMDAYRNKSIFEMPPHVYAVSDAAYRLLNEEKRELCILISGESGSGKTESSKRVLEYIAAASGHSIEVERVKDKLLQSNPVLEAFGNAKTNRNDNSSRFGKYMDLRFNYKSAPIGGNILIYLLEKSRIVKQAENERSFHIFYQLLKGASPNLLNQLGLSSNLSDYFYLQHTDESASWKMDDAHDFGRTLNAMETIELSKDEQREIFSIVAVILQFGNLHFSEEKGVVRLVDREPNENISKVVGVAPERMAEALTNRKIRAESDSVISPLNLEQALYARDALAKSMYDRLFTWLVARLNLSLQPSTQVSGRTPVIGILDIYGFEIFQNNSFEQFCINFCNEKLQQLFIELTLKSEQEEYLKEGIEWESVEFFNNSVICDLIEGKNIGIIALLDEECLRPGTTSDLSFLNKICNKLSDHPHFISHEKADKKLQKIMNRNEFKLLHYAGGVTYNVHGFLEKNNNLLYKDLRHLMGSATSSIMKEMFPPENVLSRKRPDTAITQFKCSLNNLMETLRTKQPFYIRCLKPNDFKLADIFDEKIVMHQVIYLGLLENVRVRRAGFAFRRSYEEFLSRYKCLCPATWPNFPGLAANGTQILLSHLGIKNDEYRFGRTKVFIRNALQVFKIEDSFQEQKQVLVTRLQSIWKGYVARREYMRQRQAAIVMQKWCRRFLAQRYALQRRWAAQTIRNFIKGFITRGEEPNDINRSFIQATRMQYLLRLSKSLPSSLLSYSWPISPNVCKEASYQIRRLHKLWLARKYRHALSVERRKQLKLKVLAESLLKGKKKNYQESIERPFVESRLPHDQLRFLKSGFIPVNVPSNEKIQYVSPVTKFDRHGYKRRNRIVILTDKTVYLVAEEGKSFKLKHKLLLNQIAKLEITSEKDNFLLVRIPLELKQHKGDLVLEVPFLIEMITKIIKITKKTEMLSINTPDNQFIYHNRIGGKQGVINITSGPNDQRGIMKGKQGNLIVVG